MNTKQNVERRLMDMGANLSLITQDKWDKIFTAELDAPSGFRWANHDIHCVVIQSKTRNGIYSEALSELREGLIPCNDKNCEYCNGVEEP